MLGWLADLRWWIDGESYVCHVVILPRKLPALYVAV
jgi:hypothetical protein